MSKHTRPSDSDSDAKFLGWQGKISGELFPLFNITVTDHPLYQSTVSESTLHRLRLRVPRIPLHIRRRNHLDGMILKLADRKNCSSKL